MKKLTIFLITLLLCNFVLAAKVKETYFDGKHTYFIEFVYNVNNYEYHNNIRHYPSTINVYQKYKSPYEDPDGFLVKSFKGWYTAGKCYEDNIEDLVRLATDSQYEVISWR